MPRPTVAQQLCHDIVEPILKASANNVMANMSRKSIKCINNKNEAKPTRSVYIEKKRTVSKVIPIGNTKSGINTLKSRETLLKRQLIDSGINTLISGPLKCDNYCVTMVRSRDQNPCKCSQRKITRKGNNKIIQTLSTKNFSYMDKACAHHIDAVNCGIQACDKQSIIKSSLRTTKFRNNINVNIPQKESIILQSEFDRFKKDNGHNRLKISFYSPESTNCCSGNRWTLSDLPIRGPDF